MGYKVALTYNLKRKDASLPEDYFSEFDSEETIQAMANALREKGNEVFLVEANEELLDWFRANEVDIVFNVAEGKNGRARESEVPAILDFLRIPYTGSGVLALALSLDKVMAKKIFCYEGISTPNFQLFREPNEELDSHLKFPLIVKPNREGSAIGIHRSNVVRNKEKLYKEIEKIKAQYDQEVIVEEFIEGKELTIGILGDSPPVVLPILEIDFSSSKKSGEYFYSWRMKEYQGDEPLGLNPRFFCPARLDKELIELVKDVALRAHRALGCQDVSRCDIRLSNDGVPYVLEVNSLPGLDPKESNLPLMAKAAGLSYAVLINTILESAINRNKRLERFRVLLENIRS